MIRERLKLTALVAVIVAATGSLALYTALARRSDGGGSRALSASWDRFQPPVVGAWKDDPAAGGTALVRGDTPLWIAAPGAVDPGARVEFGVTVPDRTDVPRDSRLRVSAWSVAREHPHECIVSDVVVDGRARNREGHRAFRLQMPPEATGNVLLRFALVASDGQRDTRIDHVAISDLRILHPQPTTAARTAQRAAAGRPPNILIYVIDALRPDHLGCYGYDRPTSPNIDRLASAGVVFRQAYSTSAWTRPAAASLITGLLSSGTGVRTQRDVLAGAYETLGELLRAHGYATACMSVNGHLASELGFDQGWDHHVVFHPRQLPNGEQDILRSGELTRRAIAVLHDLAAAGRPWCMLLWSADPHMPYTPAAPDRSLFVHGPAPGRVTGDERSTGLANARQIPVTPADAEYMGALYDAEIRGNDRSLGRVLEYLHRQNLFDNTLIIVLSDHGEQFFEHRQFGHAHTLYEPEIRIPLIAKFPWARGAHTESSVPVSIVDVLPTAMAAIGAPAPPLCAGQDLARLASAGDWARTTREIACELTPDGLPGFGYAAVIGAGRWKLLGTLPQLTGGRAAPLTGMQLFDLDVSEVHSVAGTNPLLVRYYQSRLTQMLNEQLAIASKRGAARPARVELKPETRENLRALGYIQ